MLDALSLRNERWGAGEANNWVFHGHAQADWALEPKAFRPGIQFGWFPMAQGGLENTQHAQVISEFQVLRDFANAADDVGLHVPGYETMVHGSPGNFKLVPWLPDTLLELAALAQHHGVPTRLLDWTRRPLHAAYFAAAAAAKWYFETKNSEPRLAIYALRSNALKELFSDGSAKVVRIPRARNSNLHAQAGLFILDRRMPKKGLRDNPLREPLDQVLRESLRVAATGTRWMAGCPLLVKFTLPWKQAPILLNHLATEGVTGASIFPGYDGVSRTVQEKAWTWGHEDDENHES